MKKLTLDLDALVVEEFSTDASQDEARGTVEAHDASFWWSGCANVHTCLC